MILIKRLGRMRINNRKRLESCSLFECPKCGSFSEHSRLHAKEKWEVRGGFVKI